LLAATVTLLIMLWIRAYRMRIKGWRRGTSLDVRGELRQ